MAVVLRGHGLRSEAKRVKLSGWYSVVNGEAGGMRSICDEPFSKNGKVSGTAAES